jgi:hypothetical protein
MVIEEDLYWAIVHGKKEDQFLSVTLGESSSLWQLPTYVVREAKLAEWYVDGFREKIPAEAFQHVRIVPVRVEVREITEQEMKTHREKVAASARNSKQS